MSKNNDILIIDFLFPLIIKSFDYLNKNQYIKFNN